MRKAFVDTLLDIAKTDERIMLLTGDLGFMFLEPFARAFPERFVNVGVAEANLVNVATGLALAGFIPFIYSASTFVSMRCYDQIRNGPVYHRLPVKIVGVGAGFDYGFSGYSHYGLEDVGILRLQRGLSLIVPADSLQLTHALTDTWHDPRPTYYRIGKNERPAVAGLDGRFAKGRCAEIGTGRDLLLITMGDMAHEVVAAAEILRGHGIGVTVALVSSFNPAPDEDLRALLGAFQTALSVEDHGIDGGLGAWAAELVARYQLRCRLVRRGITDAPLSGVTGGDAYLRRQSGISGEDIVNTALATLGRT
jgi:transketolase